MVGDSSNDAPRGARGRLPGGAGPLWLQPRRAGRSGRRRCGSRFTGWTRCFELIWPGGACDATCPSSCAFSVSSAGLGPSQMRSMRRRTPAPRSARPSTSPLTRITVPTPGTPVDGEMFSRLQAASLRRTIRPGAACRGSPWRIRSRVELSSMPRVNSRPRSLPSMSRSITMCRRLAPGIDSACAAWRPWPQVQAGGVDLDDEAVADAGAVEQQRLAGDRGALGVVDPGDLDWPRWPGP